MGVIWWVTAGVTAIAINLIASELFAWGQGARRRSRVGTILMDVFA
jgi:hypothetical protein